MKKTQFNTYNNIVAFVAFSISAISGMVLWLALPKGTGNLGGSFLFLTRHSWSTIHLYSSLLLIALVILHLILHWPWIRNIRKCLKN